MVATRDQKDEQAWPDDSQGIIRSKIRNAAKRDGVARRVPEQPIRPLEPVERPRHPGGHASALGGQSAGIAHLPRPSDTRTREQRLRDWEREQRRRGVYSDIPTSRLVLPGPPPDVTPVPIGQNDGWISYELVRRLLPAGGELRYRAALRPDGGGDLWWEDTNKNYCELKFPLTFEVIARLYAAALHARGEWSEDDPPEKEGA